MRFPDHDGKGTVSHKARPSSTEFETFDAAFDFWFDAGWEVCDGNRADERFPPLDDMIAQGAWLYGFRAAWIASNGEEWLSRQAAGSESEEEWAIEEAVSKHLLHVMDGRDRLLTQLIASDRVWEGQGIN